MMRIDDRPPVIAGIVRRHVEDAAFYWTQIDVSIDAPQLTAERADQFGRLQVAHLEGVRAAGAEAARLALNALERWRKPGEAFVAFFAALHLDDAEQRAVAIEAVLRIVRPRADLLIRGLASALAWVPAAVANRWITAVHESSDPVELVVALRGGALTGSSSSLAAGLFQHPNGHVRAAACRCAGPAHTGILDRLLDDEQWHVRAEAAIALARVLPLDAIDRRLPVASKLWKSIGEQLQHRARCTGWDRVQADRRLNRWMRHLALIAPIGHPGMRELTRHLPTRIALTSLLHHGDPALMDVVVDAMSSDEQARWAGWVWQCLSGVNLATNGLALPELPVDLDAPLTVDRKDADLGLALPDRGKIAAHLAQLPSRQGAGRTLLGQVADESTLKAILRPAADLPQGLRFVAAHALTVGQHHQSLNLRAPPSVQAASLQHLGIL